jgi:hypothetical protein
VDELIMLARDDAKALRECANELETLTTLLEGR